MTFFGPDLRNGLPIGLRSVAGFGRAVSAAPPPSGNFAVLPAAGTPTYSVTRSVLNSAGASYAVPATVLNSAGASYTPI